MLQQTQVATVIPYYLRFIRRFPDIASLARAPLDDVLAEWRGLGYYSRARALHRAAQIINQRHNGKMPSSYSELCALPGIGAYSAGAILSIAFQQDYPAVDANAGRVLSRLYRFTGDSMSPAGQRMVHGYAVALLPPGRAGEFNQALMELGEIICTARLPRCAECPLCQDCAAFASGEQDQIPAPQARKALPVRQYAAAFIQHGDNLLLARRVPRGLLGGLWELPGDALLAGELFTLALERALADYLGVKAQPGGNLAQVKHAYTHFTAMVQLYACTAQGEPSPRKVYDAVRWVPFADLGQYGLTGVTSSLLAKLGYQIAAQVV